MLIIYLLTIISVIDMTHLVILFDTLIKFKSVSVPYHLIKSFDDYCLKRGITIFGGLMEKEYQFVYID